MTDSVIRIVALPGHDNDDYDDYDDNDDNDNDNVTRSDASRLALRHTGVGARAGAETATLFQYFQWQKLFLPEKSKSISQFCHYCARESVGEVSALLLRCPVSSASVHLAGACIGCHFVMRDLVIM